MRIQKINNNFPMNNDEVNEKKKEVHLCEFFVHFIKVLPDKDIARRLDNQETILYMVD